MNWFSRAAGAAALATVSLLAACGGGGSSSGTANIRLLNASAGYPSLDFYVDTVQKSTAVGYGTVGDYTSAGTSGITTVITNSGSSLSLSSVSRSLSKDVKYTVVAFGWQGGLKTAMLQENTAAAAAGMSSLTVLNTAIDAGSVDVYLTGVNDTLDSASAVAASVAGGGIFGATTLASGSYRLRITGAGDKTDLRLDVSGLTLTSTQVATLIVTPGPSGVLVNALLVGQQGSVTALANTQARARVVASVSGNAKVTASLGGVPLLSGGIAPTIGNYAAVGAGSDAVALSVNGAAVSVPNQAIAAGADYTLLVWGDAAAPQVTVINEDNRLPAVTSDAKLRLIHGVTGLASTLTLTVDFNSPVATSNVAQGTSSSYANVTAGSAVRLEVTSPLSSTALYTLTPANIIAKGVYTLFMLGDAASPTAALRKER